MDLVDLNPMQRRAVEHTEGAVLILAGAGSGKTRVLTHRVAYLIKAMGIDPVSIIALTFTNKAAREMKTRIEGLIGMNARHMWIGTFHSLCARILRHDIEKLGYTCQFTIYDESDSLSLIERCLDELELDDKYYSPREMKNRISEAKNALMTPDAYETYLAGAFRAEKICEVYRLYQKKLAKNNALDFDDLIHLTLKLFAQVPEIKNKYAQMFAYVHVDEYQDTNHAQYVFIRELASVHGNVCVVGDDDQSIYGWRGADIRNILEFERDFPDAYVVKLEQNYRSYANILDAANAVITNNTGRKPKKLWTQKHAGELICIYTASSERDEAEFICQRISGMLNEGRRYGDLAVLYRTNAQSRVIEETMLRYGIKYKVYGGTKFYDRKEIRDVVAYLRVLNNPGDAVSLERIINNPRRGIGETSLEELRGAALACGIGLLEAAGKAKELLPVCRTAGRMAEFAAMMNGLAEEKVELPPSQFVQKVIADTGYLLQYELDGSEEAKGRIENVNEFIGAVIEYQGAAEEPTLEEFLEMVALVTDTDSMEDERGSVSLMTLHCAKGLEFPVVFLSGMEEGLFPHIRSIGEQSGLEEERRLCYVGMTRAMEKLYLTRAQDRAIFGRVDVNPPSRFLGELPAELTENIRSSRLEMKRFQSFGSGRQEKQGGKRWLRTANSAEACGEKFTVSDKVWHEKFGTGMVVAIEKSAASAILTVAFEGQGIKRLDTAFAPVKKAL
ncbi:MAG: DNA helicase PcrA [Bacillota bacterium]|nr:DNA helicase PcrA [Bacillota bacterium]